MLCEKDFWCNDVDVQWKKKVDNDCMSFKNV
jgi:hypothetical protein